MKKIGLFALLFTLATLVQAQDEQSDPQNSGCIPFTKASYVKQGLDFKKIELKIDGNDWTGDAIPLGKSIFIGVVDPKGFEADDEGLIYPNIRLELYDRTANKLLGGTDRFMGETKGYEQAMLTKLKLTLGLDEEQHGTGLFAFRIVFYDEKSKGELVLDLPFESVEEGTPPQTVRSTNVVRNVNRWEVHSTGVVVDASAVFADNKPYKEAGQHVRTLTLSDFGPLTKEEFEAGSYSFTVHNERFQYLEMTTKAVPKEVDYQQTGKYPDQGTLICTIQFNESVPVGSYIARFLWHSEDGQKTIDLLMR